MKLTQKNLDKYKHLKNVSWCDRYFIDIKQFCHENRKTLVRVYMNSARGRLVYNPYHNYVMRNANDLMKYHPELFEYDWVGYE